MKLEVRYTHRQTGKVLTKERAEYLLEENPMTLVDDYKEETLCTCGGTLYHSPIIDRSTIDYKDQIFECRKCSSKYRKYALKYPSPDTSYKYEVDGIWHKE